MNMDRPLRILQVVTQMQRAGLETMLMNYFRNIDKKKICFDFLVHRSGEYAYDNEIRSLGGRIYSVPPISPRSFPQYIKSLDSFFSEHREYNIVHCHLDALSAFALRAAKKAGVPVRIAHSHNSGFERDKKYFVRYAARMLIPLYATHFWGCSGAAIDFMFGKKRRDVGFVLPNAIDVRNFSFSNEKRIRVRDSLKIENKFVVGNIGRLCYQKNQSFLLDVFYEIINRRPDSVLLLVGDGDDRTVLEYKAEMLGIHESVLFLHSCDNIPDLLSAMDVFIFPSKFEGFGMALLEAQASGLPCVASEAVVPEIRLTNLLKCLGLDASPSVWAEEALLAAGRTDDPCSALAGTDYDILIASEMLQKKYLSFGK